MHCGINHLILYRLNDYFFKKSALCIEPRPWSALCGCSIEVSVQSLVERSHQLLWPLSFMSTFPSKVSYFPYRIKHQGEEEEIRRPPSNMIYTVVLISEKAHT